MKKTSLKKIVITLFAIALLPAFFYTAFEINSLSENEKLVNEIFDRQMNALLFGVNQHVWNYFENVAQRVDDVLISGKPDLGGSNERLFANVKPIKQMTIFDARFKALYSIVNGSEITVEVNLNEKLAEYFSSRASDAKKLLSLQEKGYRKLETITKENMHELGNDFFIIYYLSNYNDKVRLVSFLVETASTIQNVIEPKIRELAADQLEVAIFTPDGQNTGYMGSTLAYVNVVHSKRMWVFPDYILGMRSSGRDITEITSDRLKQSIFFIILLDIVLLAGIWFVYRNVKREILLAQLKSDFVSNVSHELRTPLSLIRMYSETLELGRVNDESKKQEYYKNISQEAERLTHLINNILNFSRLESGKKEYNFSSTDINALITTVYETYKDSVLEKGFTFELKLSEESIIKNVDEAALSESLINLIDNAVKYSEDQKYIAIHSKMDQDTILIEVEDHGTGIAVEQQQKIFEKFYRISSGLVHNTKGSGLGLALVKHNIESHNGEVILKSQPGKGSRFILKIPMDRS